ncbi:MAG: hypothetical protein MJZ72_10215 [Bacteroidales bacterium]|nr:hypothetical protein [Bacteroidales bacterium]
MEIISCIIAFTIGLIGGYLAAAGTGNIPTIKQVGFLAIALTLVTLPVIIFIIISGIK